MVKKHGLAALALALCALVVAGCPASKDAAQQANAAAQAGAGAQPGMKIEQPQSPAQNTPVAPPVAASAQGLTISEFSVTGMDCSDCSASIEAKLIKLPGVTTVSADFKAGTAKVQYDAAKCTPAEMVKAIESLGFKAAEKQTSASKAPGADKPQPPDAKPGGGKGAQPGGGA
jgi:copper chaperone CopZ